MEVTRSELGKIIESVELKKRRTLSDWEKDNDLDIEEFDADEFLCQEAEGLP